METYDYKKTPSERKKEDDKKLKKYSNYVKKNGNSYRRMTTKEVEKVKKKEPEPSPELDFDIDWIFDAIGGFFGFMLKILPFIFIFFVFFNTSFLDQIVAGFEMMLGDILPGTFDGSFESRIMIFIMLAIPLIFILQTNRRYRRWRLF